MAELSSCKVSGPWEVQSHLSPTSTPKPLSMHLHVFSYGYWLETELQMILLVCSFSLWDTTDFVAFRFLSSNASVLMHMRK